MENLEITVNPKWGHEESEAPGKSLNNNKWEYQSTPLRGLLWGSNEYITLQTLKHHVISVFYMCCIYFKMSVLSS